MRRSSAICILGALLSAHVVHAEPPTCSEGDHYRKRAFESELDKVKVGWTVARLKQAMGDPGECEKERWIYRAGVPDGPYVLFAFDVHGGRVRHVHRSNVGCDYTQSAE